MSFATIGAAWVGHSAIMRHIDRADAVLVRLDLLFLLVVSFLPFPTRSLGEYMKEESAERVASAILGINLALVAGTIWMLWQYVLRRGLLRPDADDADVRDLTRRLEPGLAGYLFLILVGIFFPVLAVVGYLALALAFILPLPSFRRAGRPV